MVARVSLISSAIFLSAASVADAQPFITQAMNFPLGASNNWLDLGESPFNGVSVCAFAGWFRGEYSGWSDSERALIAVNQSGQRQILVATQNKNQGLYSLRVAFGAGGAAPLVSAYLPKEALFGKHPHFVVVTKVGSTVEVWVDGILQTLVGQTGTFPAVLGSVTTATLQIGAQGPTHATRWHGQAANVAMWVGSKPTKDEILAMLAYDSLIDIRLVLTNQPTIYVPGNVFPPVELMSNRPIAGSVLPASETPSKLPIPRLSVDAMFTTRVLLEKGREPWRGASNYSASPALGPLLAGRRRRTLSRGVAHVNLHEGYEVEEVSDDIKLWSWSSRANPYALQPLVESSFPHGPLSGTPGYPASSKRSFSLSHDPAIERMFCVINETNDPTDPMFGVGRYVWSFVKEGDEPWSAASKLVGAGTYWNSVGRAKVVRLPDGSHAFGYYLKNNGENCYDSALARSVDNGASWAHWKYLVQAPDRNAGSRFEETFLIWVDGKLQAYIRVDEGVHPGINGGQPPDPLRGMILRSESPDGGDTWPIPQFAFKGRTHPIAIYRPSDGIMVTLHGFHPSIGGGYLRVSRDKGITWSAEQPIPSPHTGQYMQGDLALTEDDHILITWAQEHDSLRQVTAMWSGILDESFLESIVIDTAGP